MNNIPSYGFLIAFLAFSSPAFAQGDVDSSFHFTLLPPGLHFPPLKSNIQEPRIGIFKFLDQSSMKVDIGNSVDVFGLTQEGGLEFTAGIDFMAYALATGSQGLRLQIDALDGFFGGNLTASKPCPSGDWIGRLRLLHHSAHLVDGDYNNNSGQWMNGRGPIAYTRDFGELVVSRESERKQKELNYRLYGGFSWATLVRPTSIQRTAYLTGLELYAPLLLDGVNGTPSNIFLAYTINLNGTPEYQASHQLQLGWKVGDWYGSGPSVYLGYFNGRQMFAEYYDSNITTIGAGFTVDFQ